MKDFLVSSCYLLIVSDIMRKVLLDLKVSRTRAHLGLGYLVIDELGLHHTKKSSSNYSVHVWAFV